MVLSLIIVVPSLAGLVIVVFDVILDERRRRRSLRGYGPRIEPHDG
jgi:hypothetical protein